MLEAAAASTNQQTYQSPLVIGHELYDSIGKYAQESCQMTLKKSSNIIFVSIDGEASSECTRPCSLGRVGSA